jgi:alpha-D-xyloside xylohydrolase
MATAKISLALMCLAALAQPMLAIAATFEQQKDGVIVRLEKGAVKLQVCTERIIRVLYDPTGAFAPAQSLVIVNKWQSCEFSVREAKDHVELQTAKLNVRVANRSGAISFFDKNCELLFRENPEMPKSVTPARVLDENTHHAQLNIKFSASEGVYGLGQHQNGVYAIIPIRWNEKTQTLTIGERKGRFPGMLEQRTFRIVWVSRDHGTGVDIADRPDAVVRYDGRAQYVKKQK